MSKVDFHRYEEYLEGIKQFEQPTSKGRILRILMDILSCLFRFRRVQFEMSSSKSYTERALDMGKSISLLNLIGFQVLLIKTSVIFQNVGDHHNKRNKGLDNSQ